jgi:rubrerythrin
MRMQDTSARVATNTRKLDLCCSACGYGIVRRTPPERCPMCGGTETWDERPATARSASQHERLAR